VPSLSRSELAAYAACALLIALLGWRALRGDRQTPASMPASARTAARTATTSGGDGPTVRVDAAAPTSALVHVVGAVRRPGVYRLAAGRRVQDAIRRAGGARPGADLQAINLAAKLADAQQVVVPRRGTAAGGSAAAAPASGTAAPGPASGPVNLNAATAEQLDTLDGVGPATAQKILEYRQQHGGFRSVDDLAQIAGIGPKKLEALRGQVTV
jgi:competence protein ComEA